MEINKEVDEKRAVVLTGLSTNDLRSLAREAALGHHATSGDQLVFTYEELRQICLLAAHAHL
jgi:hypothetical protein